MCTLQEEGIVRTTSYRTLLIGTVAAFALAAVACGGDDAGTRLGTGATPANGGGTLSDTFGPANGTPRDSVAGSESKSALSQANSDSAPLSQPATGASGDTPALASTLDRKIIFNATIDLTVKDVPAAYNTVSRIVKGAGGFVEKSSFLNSAGDEKSRSATLTLRVPATQYEDVLGELRTMDGAQVQREGSKSSEVTEQYTDLQSRLRNLQSTEAQYLKLLEQAKSINDILTVNDRINSVRSQIEQIQGRLKVLDNLTDMATIDVTLAPIVPAKVENGGGPKSVGEAFADAWEASLDVMRHLAAAGAVVAVAAIWLAVPAILVLVVALFGRRNRPGAAAS
jgi:hypothetical protein